jgi:hypothetical protein
MSPKGGKKEKQFPLVSLLHYVSLNQIQKRKQVPQQPQTHFFRDLVSQEEAEES